MPSLGDRLVARHLARLAFALEVDLELLELVLIVGQLRRPQAVDEQPAVEMIGLVLHDAGHQPLDFAVNLLPARL